MHRTVAPCLSSLLSPGPGVAQDLLMMAFRNDSSRPANISGVYQIRDGKVIDDNLGFTNTIQPGEIVALALNHYNCGNVHFSALLGQHYDKTAEKIFGETDLCRNRLIVLHD